MPTFERFDVVSVPFPYVEREARKRRPAVIVSGSGIQERHGLAWALMVTSAANPGWPDDIPVGDLVSADLPKPSVIRPAKVATVEVARCEYRGRLAGETVEVLLAALRRIVSPTH